MDSNLIFLNKCSAEELGVLVKLMENKFSESLPQEAKIYPTNHIAEIADEFCRFGGNTIANLLRGGDGVSYREILTDVCKDLKVPFNKAHDIEHIERNMLETVMESAWDSMNEEDRRRLLDEMGYKGSTPTGGIWGLLAVTGAQTAGFGFYQAAVVVANIVAKQVTGTGLTLVANATLTKLIGGMLVWLAPIMWAWTLIDIASPSKKVTVPGCIYIAAMRQVKKGSN